MVTGQVRRVLVAKSSVERKVRCHAYIVLHVCTPDPLPEVSRKIPHTGIRDQRNRTAVKKFRDVAKCGPTAGKSTGSAGVQLVPLKGKSKFQSVNSLSEKEVIRSLESIPSAMGALP